MLFQLQFPHLQYGGNNTDLPYRIVVRREQQDNAWEMLRVDFIPLIGILFSSPRILTGIWTLWQNITTSPKSAGQNEHFLLLLLESFPLALFAERTHGQVSWFDILWAEISFGSSQLGTSHVFLLWTISIVWHLQKCLLASLSSIKWPHLFICLELNFYYTFFNK